jgi:hypothetical protein
VYKEPIKRLKSRNPIGTFKNSKNKEENLCNTHWEDGVVLNNDLISDAAQLVPGFEFLRAAWIALNRVRIGQGRGNYLMHK